MHEVEYDDQKRCLSDKKLDADGNVIGEGIYKDGQYVGRKEYFMHQGYRHEAEYDVLDRCVSDKKFDAKGNVICEGIYKDGKFMGYKTPFNTTSYGR
ncbi:MAG: hypothetical protein J5896_02005 [Alphaproteobacteria bacterium]|nr:hypothetical protein [Alphaproteobacteria bacterium]